MVRKNKILLSFFIIISSIFVIIIGAILYDRITINNKYGIDEKKIDIPIFVYHNIVDDLSQVEYDYMETTKQTFEKQILGLQKIGYRFITFEELEKYKKNEIELYKKSCIITFDDGCEGVYKNAFEVARKHQIPFTMFVITDFVGQENRITWEEAKQMKDSGLVTIASHSTEHLDFSKLTVEQALEDVDNSYKKIEEQIGPQNVKIFTYPYGLYKDEQCEALRNKGYIQNLTDNKINKSNLLDLSKLHRCYPLNDSIYKMQLKIIYRSIRYN